MADLTGPAGRLVPWDDAGAAESVPPEATGEAVARDRHASAAEPR